MSKNIIIAGIVAASFAGSVSAAPTSINLDLKTQKNAQATLLDKMLIEVTPILARPECTVKGI